ncbi:metallo-mystery pair system four-Cys motif protein [Leptospira bouyouniensis]|uniref:Metallo-mystery pair system four-Cys motif protein n=1 Tax=Leptospira bouyouniensis TaxID=2484911 RepID=A0A7I0IU40_9LEPT|nr:MbnP family copper-binding protein [Leptospira bouyouniensis]TGL08350.1 metallo-mystery pair system four-Cys motif protein [Leptospira bouyouniensis]
MKLLQTIFTSLSLFALLSCGTSAESDDSQALALLALASAPQTVNLNFEALANGQNLTTGSNITANARTVQFRDFRLFVSEVKMVRADGTTADVTLTTDNVWQANGVALIDFETTQTTEKNLKVTGSAPAGAYTGIQYTVGVPESLNHLDRTTQVSPLNIGPMYWAWTSGYKHSKIEFSFDSGTTWTNLHVGSTNCTGAPNYGNCGKKYRASIQLNGSINPSNQTISLSVDQLIKDHTGGINTTCMPAQAGADCTPLIRAFGINETSGSVDSSISQRVFSLK